MQTYSATVNPGKITLLVSPKIVFSADAVTDQYTAGNFMFLQIVDTTLRQFTDPPPTPPGGSWYIQNNIDRSGGTDPSLNFDGPLLDDPDAILSYGGFYLGQGASYWHVMPDSSLPAGGQGPPATNDGPYFNESINDQNISVSESFSMYWMYQSDIQGSAWIALNEVDWSWSISATNVGTALTPVWTGPGASSLTPSAPATPADPFPSWVNLISRFVDPVDDPYRSGP